jgi:catechol 2,3-dioxygenase-like lactoylglutathione lyase family enzyme
MTLKGERTGKSESTGRDIEEKRKRLRTMIPADLPEAPTGGVDHIAVYAKDLEKTARFYSEIMGMPFIGITANRDVEDSTHMNVAIGNGMALSFFDFPHVARLQRRAPEGVGNVMHVAMPIPRHQFQEVKDRLDANRVKYQEVGGSLYVDDPNGLGIELMLRG